MSSASAPGPQRRRRSPKSSASGKKAPTQTRNSGWGVIVALFALIVGTAIVYFALDFHASHTVSLQTPVKVQFQWPLVVARRMETPDAFEAQKDQSRPLTAYQQYACQKFGSACRVALAIQRAENPQGKCEIYHYNHDGTLDWGYFQINTVHLERPDLNLRDLLDCRANIDFAYTLYVEHHGFTPWATYNNGAYRKFLKQ